MQEGISPLLCVVPSLSLEPSTQPMAAATIAYVLANLGTTLPSPTNWGLVPAWVVLRKFHPTILAAAVPIAFGSHWQEPIMSCGAYVERLWSVHGFS